MGVDKSYGSGYKNTGMSKATVSKQKIAKAPKSVTPAKRKTATALLAKNKADLAISRSPNRNTKAAPMIGELSKMLTGVGTDAKGKFSIDPMGLAFALPLGKVVKAAGVLRGAGRVAEAAALEARAGAKLAGKSAASDIAAAGGKSYLNSPMGKFSIVGAGVPTKTFEGAALRGASRNVFPRGTDLAKRALKAKSEVRTATRESLNYEFPFNRVINEAERIERKYGLTQKTAEEGIKQAKKAATAGEKYRAGLAGKSTRVAELEKRLKFPKKGGR